SFRFPYFFYLILLPPRPTLFPYTSLFRSDLLRELEHVPGLVGEQLQLSESDLLGVGERSRTQQPLRSRRGNVRGPLASRAGVACRACLTRVTWSICVMRVACGHLSAPARTCGRWAWRHPVPAGTSVRCWRGPRPGWPAAPPPGAGGPRRRGSAP